MSDSPMPVAAASGDATAVRDGLGLALGLRLVLGSRVGLSVRRTSQGRSRGLCRIGLVQESEFGAAGAPAPFGLDPKGPEDTRPLLLN